MTRAFKKIGQKPLDRFLGRRFEQLSTAAIDTITNLAGT
jgi:hypothetical protein